MQTWHLIPTQHLKKGSCLSFPFLNEQMKGTPFTYPPIAPEWSQFVAHILPSPLRRNTRIYLKWWKSAIWDFVAWHSVSTKSVYARMCVCVCKYICIQARCCLFAWESIICKRTPLPSKDTSQRMPFRIAVELQRSIYCMRWLMIPGEIAIFSVI